MTFICLNIELRTQPLIILIVIAGTDKERPGCSKIQIIVLSEAAVSPNTKKATKFCFYSEYWYYLKLFLMKYCFVYNYYGSCNICTVI
jgi:hypothetical protein